MWLDLYTAYCSLLEARRTAYNPLAEVRRPWHPGTALAPRLTNRQHHVCLLGLVPDAADAAGASCFPLAQRGCFQVCGPQDVLARQVFGCCYCCQCRCCCYSCCCCLFRRPHHSWTDLFCCLRAAGPLGTATTARGPLLPRQQGALLYSPGWIPTPPTAHLRRLGGPPSTPPRRCGGRGTRAPEE